MSSRNNKCNDVDFDTKGTIMSVKEAALSLSTFQYGLQGSIGLHKKTTDPDSSLSEVEEWRLAVHIKMMTK